MLTHRQSSSPRRAPAAERRSPSARSLAQRLVHVLVVVDRVDAAVSDANGLEDDGLALAALVAKPVDADDDSVVADVDELGNTDALVAGSLLELLP